jgi:acyl-CoA hydrolase
MGLSAISMTKIVLPSDANHMGNTFGGNVMAWMDNAATVAALRHCRHSPELSSLAVVTINVDAMAFLGSSQCGDRITCYAQVNRAFGSTMEVGVRVEAQKLGGQVRHINTGYVARVERSEWSERSGASEAERAKRSERSGASEAERAQEKEVVSAPRERRLALASVVGARIGCWRSRRLLALASQLVLLWEKQAKSLPVGGQPPEPPQRPSLSHAHQELSTPTQLLRARTLPLPPLASLPNHRAQVPDHHGH